MIHHFFYSNYLKYFGWSCCSFLAAAGGGTVDVTQSDSKKPDQFNKIFQQKQRLVSFEWVCLVSAMRLFQTLFH